MANIFDQFDEAPQGLGAVFRSAVPIARPEQNIFDQFDGQALPDPQVDPVGEAAATGLITQQLPAIDPNPEGTMVGRAIRRGGLRTASSLPQALAIGDATLLQDSARTEQAIIRDVFLQVTQLPEVPRGVDISTPEMASAAISAAGYPVSYPNIFRQVYDKRIQNLANMGDPAAVAERGAANQAVASDLMRRSAEIPFNPTSERMRRALAETPDTWRGLFDTVKDDPVAFVAFLGEVGFESLPQIAASLAVGAVTRSPVAASLTMGAGAITQEFGSSVAEFLTEQGVEIKTKEDALAVLNNPGLLQAAGERGLTRGLVVAAFEMLGQGVAAKALYKTAARNFAAQTVTQVATGAGGEAAARAAAGQEQSVIETVIEGLAEGVTTPAEIAVAVAAKDPRKKAIDAFTQDIETAVPLVSPEQMAIQVLKTPQEGVPGAQAPTIQAPAPTPAPAPAQPVTEGPGTAPTTPTAVAAPVVGPAPEQPKEPDDQKTQPTAPAGEDPVVRAAEPRDLTYSDRTRRDVRNSMVRALKFQVDLGEEGNIAGSNVVAQNRQDAFLAGVDAALNGDQKAPEFSSRPEKGLSEGGFEDARRFADDLHEEEFAVPTVTAADLSGLPLVPLDEDIILNNFQRPDGPVYIAHTPEHFALMGFSDEVIAELAAAQKQFIEETEGAPDFMADLQAKADERAEEILASYADKTGEKVVDLSAARKRKALADGFGSLQEAAHFDARTAIMLEGMMGDAMSLGARDESVTSILYEGGTPGAPSFIPAAIPRDLSVMFESRKPVLDDLDYDFDALLDWAVTQDIVNKTLAKYQTKGRGIKVSDARPKPVEADTTTQAEDGARRKRAEDRGVLSRPPTTRRRVSDARQKLEEKTPPRDKEKSIITGGKPPKGSLTPTFVDFSFSNRSSIYENAFREVGIEPDAAVLLDTDDQIRLLRKAIFQKYGIRVRIPQKIVTRKTITGRKAKGLTARASPRDIIDQLSNAYRQFEMLAFTLGIPHSAIGLPNKDGDTIILSLTDRLQGGHLGVYEWNEAGERIIHLTGRSNSFAHEWGHALDHWMGGYLFDGNEKMMGELLSKSSLEAGVDASATHDVRAAQAFADLMRAIWGDEAKLAALEMDLERRATQVRKKDGKPHKNAIAAQKQLDRLRQGKRPPREVWSKYFKNAREFDDLWKKRSYFSSPHEMLARAIETYAATQAALASGLPLDFLTKPLYAYQESQEERAKMTYPRDAELTRISDAIAALGRVLARNALPGTPATKSDDVDTTNVRDQIASLGSKVGTIQKQKDANEVTRQRIKRSKNVFKETRTLPQLLLDGAQYALLSGTLEINWSISRESRPVQVILHKIVDPFMEDPGRARKQSEVWERAAEKEFKIHNTSFRNTVELYGMEQYDEEQMGELRRLLTVAGATTKDKKMQEGAAELRRLLTNRWRYATNAGLQIGFVKHGWLPRIFHSRRAEAQPKDFIRDAMKVYRLMFSRDVRRADLNDQIDDLNKLISDISVRTIKQDDAATIPADVFSDEEMNTIDAWKKALRPYRAALNKLDAANEEGDGGAIAAAQAKVDETLAAFEEDHKEVHEEALSVVERAFALVSAQDWHRRLVFGSVITFDTQGPQSDYMKARTLPPETDDIMQKWLLGTPLELIADYLMMLPKRVEYAKRVGVADGKKTEGWRQRDLLEAAQNKGASAEITAKIEAMIAQITGRARKSGFGERGLSIYGQWIYTLYTVSMLSLATIRSLPEAHIAGMRSGNAIDGLRAFALSLVQMTARLNKSKKAALRSEMAQLLGIITHAAQETLAVNRFGGDMDPDALPTMVLQRAFRYNLLTYLTNAQRAAILPVTNMMIARYLKKASKGQKFAKDWLLEIGIGPEDTADLLAWLDKFDGAMPSKASIMDEFGNPPDAAARLWSEAMRSLNASIIQNPTRYSRPRAALDPKFRMIYGITGFLFQFYLSIMNPLTKRGIDPQREGEILAKYMVRRTFGTLKNTARTFPTIAALSALHVLASVIRIAFDGDWDRLEDMTDEELADWIIKEALTQPGWTGGPLTIPLNAYWALGFGGQLSNVYTGPQLGAFLRNLQDIAAIAVNNSPKNKRAERKLIDGAASIITTGAMGAFYAALPGGPLSQVAGTAVTAANRFWDFPEMFANALVGEEEK